MDAAFLQSKHQAGKPYADYVRTGNAQQQENWNKFYEYVHLTDAHKLLIGSFTRTMRVIGLSGIWCGDCVQQCPLVAKIAEASGTSGGGGGKVDLRFVDRDEHADLQKLLRICAGNRVPVFLFCAEDYELVGWYGDRTLTRYRAIAQRQLGPSCPLPGAPVEKEEVAATLHEWLDEVERVHLLLRLSARLRQKHGD